MRAIAGPSRTLSAGGASAKRWTIADIAARRAGASWRRVARSAQRVACACANAQISASPASSGTRSDPSWSVWSRKRVFAVNGSVACVACHARLKRCCHLVGNGAMRSAIHSRSGWNLSMGGLREFVGLKAAHRARAARPVGCCCYCIQEGRNPLLSSKSANFCGCRLWRWVLADGYQVAINRNEGDDVAGGGLDVAKAAGGCW